MSTEVIHRLNESPDGVITTFTTPGLFVAGTFRLIINGIVYEPDDDRFGWTETDHQTLELIEAPLTGDVLQGIYTMLQSNGTPFDPGGALP